MKVLLRDQWFSWQFIVYGISKRIFKGLWFRKGYRKLEWLGRIELFLRCQIRMESFYRCRNDKGWFRVGFSVFFREYKVVLRFSQRRLGIVNIGWFILKRVLIIMVFGKVFQCCGKGRRKGILQKEIMRFEEFIRKGNGF